MMYVVLNIYMCAVLKLHACDVPLQDPPIWIADEDDQDDDNTHSATELHPVIRLCMIFLLMWQCLFHVSDAGIAVLVIFVRHLFRLLPSLTASPYLYRLCPQLAQLFCMMYENFLVCWMIN